jgi:hypothetical protein
MKHLGQVPYRAVSLKRIEASLGAPKNAFSAVERTRLEKGFGAKGITVDPQLQMQNREAIHGPWNPSLATLGRTCWNDAGFAADRLWSG